ncbi:lytic murein transglycosylase [Labrys wisconsinensis]|uniref:Lytic murein transglycosylase n=1 Tax=Labrys wisconsinensis TaxID=425677 RepID=A0ABU0JAR8_9HYPH|nr:lytic murein transglycosylase [Labrys wisconsinensis]MDQ0471368.1 lytic murein transglycosylase [Labrys wisconsinensis]
MRRSVLFAFITLLSAAPAAAAQCGQDASGFPAWLEAFKGEATSAGISQATVTAAFDGVTYDPKTIGYDRNQKVFKQSFEEFSGRMVNAYRIKKAQAFIAKNQALLARIEERFGVPGPVLTAIWGLETDFGANIGNFQTIRSLATLAYDCRRSDRFHDELINALKILDEGDMPPSALRGAWAGELGQTQFMPSSYIKFAVDFDGDGKRDLLHSVPDVLASTANYLKSYGWVAGQPWDPGTANFAVIKEWNKSDIYARTIALLANRIAGES